MSFKDCPISRCVATGFKKIYNLSGCKIGKNGELMKFDMTQYQGKYAMNCKTREDAQVFLEFLHKHGKSWSDGESYKILYYTYENQTAYAFNEGRYGSVGWYESHGYTVLNFEDFEWNDDIIPTNRDLRRFNNFLSQFAIN